jgi:hypothetical protein
MKITLKTIILVALVIFYLVVIISNFTTYEGLENKPIKQKTVEELETPTELSEEDQKYGISGEGDMMKT